MDALVLETLKEIKEDTKALAVLVHEVEELKKFRDGASDRIVKTVKNNSDLADEFNKRALDKIIAHLDTEEERYKFDNRVKSVLDKEMLKVLIKWLSIQGSVLAIVFTAVVSWVLS